MTSTRLSVHEGVSCDACSRSDFRGKRYKCLNCYDYDLCETCFEAGATSKLHKAEHAVQCIITPSEYELYYSGEQADQPQSFTCPICATMGFTLAGLREHVSSEHGDINKHVVCPVCAATPGGDPNYMTGDLAVHLTTGHTRNRDLLDDQSALRRPQRVSQFRFGTIGSPVPTCQPTRQLPATVNIPPTSLPDLDSIGTFSDLLSHTLEGTERTSTLPPSSWAATEIQQIRLRLQAARQELQTAAQQHNRPRFRDNIPAITSVYPLPPARSPDPVAVGLKPILVEPPAPDDPRFLLNSIVEAGTSDPQQQALEVERADRSLFVQELLLSALAQQTPVGIDALLGKPKFAAVASMGAPEPAMTTRPDATATTAPEQSVSTSLKTTATAGAEPTVTICPEPTHGTSPQPTVTPSLEPSVTPSLEQSVTPSLEQSVAPSLEPSVTPSLEPSVTPSLEPSVTPSLEPSVTPSLEANLTTSLEPAVAESQETTPPTSVELTAAGDLGPTATTSAEPTAPTSTGPADSISSELTGQKPEVDCGELPGAK